MAEIGRALARFRENPSKNDPSNPFTVVSIVSSAATRDEVQSAWGDPPIEALALWDECRDARLFEDINFGQWGLLLLDPKGSAERTLQERSARTNDFREHDVVMVRSWEIRNCWSSLLMRVAHAEFWLPFRSMIVEIGTPSAQTLETF